MNYLVLHFLSEECGLSGYQDAYSDLASIGLRKVHTNSQGGQDVIPTTAAMGFFDGNSASAVCGHIRDRIRAAFAARNLRSEIFVVVGGDWSWVAAST